MADLGRIGDRIRGLAAQRKNVRLEDIAWVVNQLGRNGYFYVDEFIGAMIDLELYDE
jgi:hypothetical protein